MNLEKDYYGILGVLPNAEDIVIRAAYRALAQRYHPDRNGEASAQSSAKMTEINEAFSVLSNPDLRKKYDQHRRSRQSSAPNFDDFDEDDPKTSDPTEKDWKLAERFYPSLSQSDARLKRISWKLSSAFRAQLLESKDFEKQAQIAAALELGFLERYFGSDRDILKFASEMIQAGHKDVARDLNEAIRVLGTKASADTVISTIKLAHPSVFPQRKRNSVDYAILEYYVREIRSFKATFNHYQRFIELLGGTFKSHGFLSGKYDVKYKTLQATIDGFDKVRPWFIEHVISDLE